MAEVQAPTASPPGGRAAEALRAHLEARVEDMRVRGAARFDPVGWRVIEAMMRRLDVLTGPARVALVRRIERRLAGLRVGVEHAGGTNPLPARRRPLAELLEHVARQAGVADPDGGLAGTEAQAAAELKSVRQFRSTWSRLSLEQQLARARAAAPDNAGPLNSHHLALQALIRMGDIAPQYLEGFIAQVDALLWLQQADATRGAAQRTAVRKGEARTSGGRGGRARKPSAPGGG
ncbi:MAG: DUF2894 domain-containing protein [Thauera sp.]|nr:DUF2894 domain-containing protein [Thauera sp.]